MFSDGLRNVPCFQEDKSREKFLSSKDAIHSDNRYVIGISEISFEREQ